LAVNVGDLYVLLAVVLWGLYSVISRKATQSRSVFSVTVISTWMALPLFIRWQQLLGWQPASTNWSWHLLLAVVYIGIFPSAAAFLSWNEGVRRVGANRAMVFYNMLPVYGSILGVILLGRIPRGAACYRRRSDSGGQLHRHLAGFENHSRKEVKRFPLRENDVLEKQRSFRRTTAEKLY